MFYILLILIAQFFSIQTHASLQSFENVKPYLQERVARGYMTGVAFGTSEGQTHHKLIYGDTDYGVSSPSITEETLFEIGSLTKTFTGLLLFILGEEGKCDLDDPVIKHMSIKLPKKDGVDITLRHLLMHTSGLPYFPENLLRFSPFDNPYENYPEAEWIRYLERTELAFTPGTKEQYSNNGSALLGLVLSKIGDDSFENLIKTKILNPLNMANTGFGTGPDSLPIATPHFGDYPVPLWNMGIFKASGGLRSTLSDMMKYVEALMGNMDQKSILGKAIQKCNIEAPWVGKDDFEHTWISHTGATAGSTARMMVDLTHKRGGVILTNNSLEKNTELLYPALIEANAEQNKILEGLVLVQEVALNGDIIRDLSGHWKGDLGEMQVDMENNTLRLIYDADNIPLLIKTGGKVEKFYPKSTHEFFSKATDRTVRYESGKLIFSDGTSFEK